MNPSDTRIKVLGVSGSPRRGATDRAVNEALQYAGDKHGAEVDYFSAHRKTIGFCTHCDVCVNERQGCAFDDDMTELYEKLRWADAWIIGSPTYQGQISGQLKTVFDRCRAPAVSTPHVFRGKVGAGIAVGGDRNGGQESVLHAIIDFCLMHEVFPVAGGAYGANLGAAIWSRDRGAEGVLADEVGLAAIRRVTDRLVGVTWRVAGIDWSAPQGSA